MLSKLIGGLRAGCTPRCYLRLSCLDPMKDDSEVQSWVTWAKHSGCAVYYPHPRNGVYSQNPKTLPGPSLQISYHIKKGRERNWWEIELSLNFYSSLPPYVCLSSIQLWLWAVLWILWDDVYMKKQEKGEGIVDSTRRERQSRLGQSNLGI